MNIRPFFEDKHSALYLGDSCELLSNFKTESVDVIFADPPYFLSNNGITCKGGRVASVNKGDWDKAATFDDKHEFNRRWISLCRNILKPNGTIWVSGTLHNIYSVGVALEQTGFKIMNNITWQKTNPPPNLSCRYFTHSTETILWAKKNASAKHFFNYELMKELNGGKQMKDVWSDIWTGTLTPQREKVFGKHPTQKPLYLLEKIILASTREGDLVLDPFCGSGTTGVVCKKWGRRFCGIDITEEFVALSRERLTQTRWKSAISTTGSKLFAHL